MPAKINLIGQKFGKLLVISETNKRKNKSVVWQCQCDCGNVQEFSTKQLRSDGLIQCHQCGNHRQPKTDLTPDIIGKKFNSLTVVEKTDQRRGDKILYKCKCDCGTITYVNRTDLQNGHIKSCGCMKLKYKIGDIVNNKRIIGLVAEDENKQNIEKRHYYRCKCLLCGREYDALAATLEKSEGCGCLKSIGQQNIKKILDEFNVLYLQEYRFPNTLYRFDFAILDENKQIVRLIEFDGEQHYQENVKDSGWNTIEHYEKVRQRDIAKNKLAKQYNIPLVRIPYWERYNLNIDMLLRDNIYTVYQS